MRESCHLSWIKLYIFKIPGIFVKVIASTRPNSKSVIGQAILDQIPVSRQAALQPHVSHAKQILTLQHTRHFQQPYPFSFLQKKY